MNSKRALGFVPALSRRQSISPWIEDFDPRRNVFLGIARHYRQAVVLRCCCDNQVGLGEGMARLAAFFDQEAPLEHDVFRDRQHALLEHWAYLVGKPIIEFGSARRIGQQFDAEAYFGES